MLPCVGQLDMHGFVAMQDARRVRQLFMPHTVYPIPVISRLTWNHPCILVGPPHLHDRQATASNTELNPSMQCSKGQVAP